MIELSEEKRPQVSAMRPTYILFSTLLRQYSIHLAIDCWKSSKNVLTSDMNLVLNTRAFDDDADIALQVLLDPIPAIIDWGLKERKRLVAVCYNALF